MTSAAVSKNRLTVRGMCRRAGLYQGVDKDTKDEGSKNHFTDSSQSHECDEPEQKLLRTLYYQAFYSAAV